MRGTSQGKIKVVLVLIGDYEAESEN